MGVLNVLNRKLDTFSKFLKYNFLYVYVCINLFSWVGLEPSTDRMWFEVRVLEVALLVDVATPVATVGHWF